MIRANTNHGEGERRKGFPQITQIYTLITQKNQRHLRYSISDICGKP